MRGNSVVIVGAGQAGSQVAVALRQQGYRDRITVIGAEPEPPYQRPPLTKAYLAGEVDRSGLALRADSYYAQQDIDVRPGETVTSIDRAAHQVRLGSGPVLPYTHLVLATGARPRPLPVPGADLPGVHTVRTVADADALRQQVTGPDKLRIVVIGAGFVGLEFAAIARTRGHGVTVVEALPRVLSRSVSGPIAEYLLAQHRANGVTMELGTGIVALHGGGGVDAVELADGRRLPADLVVVGIGVVPNVDLATAAGLAQHNGIVVDEQLRTEDASVYAVGDCVSFPSAHTGNRIRLESVQNAADQADHVAKAILGSTDPYTALPWFDSDQYAVKLRIAGIVAGYDRVALRGDPEDGRFSVFCFLGDRLLGVESVNKPADHLMARRLLAAGHQLTPDILATPDFDLPTYVRNAVLVG